MRLVEAVLKAPINRPSGFLLFLVAAGASRSARSDIGDGDNSMQVIRHYNPGVRIFRKIEHGAPNLVDDLSVIIQIHIPIDNVAETRSPALRTNCDEIQTLG